MAKRKVKGTQLQQDLAGVYTAVSQLTSLSLSGAEGETVEADTLDNPDAGILHEETGRTESGTLEGEMIYDAALQGHKNILALLTNPAKENWRIVDPDDAYTIACTTSGHGFDPSWEQGELVRASFSFKITGDITWP